MSTLIAPGARTGDALEGADPNIRDVGLADFMTHVIEASRECVVVMIFRQLGAGLQTADPVLEKVVRSYKGNPYVWPKSILIKNRNRATDARSISPRRVRVFPRPAGGWFFMGALLEAQIKAWIDKLVKATGAAAGTEAPGLDTALQQAAEFLAKGDTPTAQSIYADILDMEPGNAAAYARLTALLDCAR